MVERRTPEREVEGSILTQVARVVSLSKIHLPPKSTGYTQKAVAPSQHDSEIAYWDVKKNETKRNIWVLRVELWF